MAILNYTKQEPKPPVPVQYEQITEQVINLDDDNAHEQLQAVPEGHQITTAYKSKNGQIMFGTYQKPHKKD